MRRLLCGVFVFSLGGAPLLAQGSAPAALSPKAQAKKPGDAAKQPNLPENFLKSDGPITTEIYSEEAFFDSGKKMGTFSGHVIVKDPRFNLQSDKLTVYISSGENQGLEKVVAEGNVGVVHDRPDAKGGPPTRSIARAESAIYTAKDGNVELTGTPRVQSGLNTLVATSPSTVMILNQDGQLTTRGPSRTEIRQETKPEQPRPEQPKP